MTEQTRTEYLSNRDVTVAVTYIDEGPPVVGLCIHCGQLPDNIARIRAQADGLDRRHSSAIIDSLLPSEVDDVR
jgi:hypothetical protein